MLREVLLSLAGHPGGLVLENEDGFYVNGGDELLSKAELHLIERTIQAGFRCRYLAEFVTTVRQIHFASTGIDSPGYPGLYVYGLALAIEQYLDTYRGQVSDLEAQVLA